jgi:malate dehydrogenase (oxaloacetate-decarboxylating)
LINALKVANKKIGESKIIINGAGAAGMTIAKLIISYGVKHLIVCDTKGAIYKGRK